jgi:uncharacterized membrane protein
MYLLRFLFIITNSALSFMMLESVFNHDDVEKIIPCDPCGFFYRSIPLYVLYSMINGLIFLSFAVLLFFGKFKNTMVILSIVWPLALMYYARS